MTTTQCRHCGSELDSEGLCTEEVCPFSERQQSGGRYVVIRVDFNTDINDYRAYKEADGLVEYASASGVVTILEEGVAE